MPKRTPAELNALDAAKIERRRRSLARAKDPAIGDLEHLRDDLRGWAATENLPTLTVAADELSILIEARIDLALAAE